MSLSSCCLLVQFLLKIYFLVNREVSFCIIISYSVFPFVSNKPFSRNIGLLFLFYFVNKIAIYLLSAISVYTLFFILSQELNLTPLANLFLWPPASLANLHLWPPTPLVNLLLWPIYFSGKPTSLANLLLWPTYFSSHQILRPTSSSGHLLLQPT